MQTPSKLQIKPTPSLFGKRCSTSSVDSNLPKGFTEASAIALLDAMLKAGRRPEPPSQEAVEEEEEKDVFEADYTDLAYERSVVALDYNQDSHKMSRV